MFSRYTLRTNKNRAWWAHTREKKEHTFVPLVKWIHERVLENQSSTKTMPHEFYYGHYEVVVLRRSYMHAAACGRTNKIRLADATAISKSCSLRETLMKLKYPFFKYF